MSIEDSVWEKGRKDPNNDPAVWRKDACGAWIRRDHYGNTNSEYGWQIDHIIPQARGGPDTLLNYQPLLHQNNAAKAAGRLDCAVTANEVHNAQR